MYYPLQNTCMMATSGDERPDKDDNNVYAMQHARADRARRGERRHASKRSRSKTGKTEWKFEQRAGMLSLISTGSGLLFGGDVNGRFRAYDQRTGEVLWEVNLGAPVNGYPATFCGRRQAIRRRQHGRLGPGFRARASDARAASGGREPALRVRAALADSCSVPRRMR